LGSITLAPSGSRSSSTEARVEDLIDRFHSGGSVADIAEDFDVPQHEVEDVIRVATRLAA
jgi:uncharacterized protein (DUF433 family)